jgi:hypothetical protein
MSKRGSQAENQLLIVISKPVEFSFSLGFVRASLNRFRLSCTDFYVDRKPDRIDVVAVCMCKPPKDKNQLGCLADCMNR